MIKDKIIPYYIGFTLFVIIGILSIIIIKDHGLKLMAAYGSLIFAILFYVESKLCTILDLLDYEEDTPENLIDPDIYKNKKLDEFIEKP